MNFLILGADNSPVSCICEKFKQKYIEWTDPIDISFLKNNSIDFIISYRYRHIISKDVIQFLENKIINLHISYLPWNRGADPNLWSFLENTPKGVTIHFINEGIDTGDIIIQKQVLFNSTAETLKTSYIKLENEIIALLESIFPLLLSLNLPRIKQIGKGSYHKSKEKSKFENLFKTNWDTNTLNLCGKAL